MAYVNIHDQIRIDDDSAALSVASTHFSDDLNDTLGRRRALCRSRVFGIATACRQERGRRQGCQKLFHAAASYSILKRCSSSFSGVALRSSSPSVRGVVKLVS